MNFVLLLFFAPACVYSWYLPGTSPSDFLNGQSIPVLANAITPLSDADTIHSLLSYDYYTPQFHFCKPANGVKSQSQNLGSILFGDRLFDTPIELSMKRPEICKTLCRVEMSGQDAAFVNERIKEKYAVNWLVDGLPAAKAKVDAEQGTIFYSIGFDLGNATDDRIVLNNHYDILIEYHQKDQDIARVVGVLVWPASYDNYDASGGDACASTNPPLSLRTDRTNQFFFTYSVQFRESKVAWATRYDNYLPVYAPRIHYLSLFNSVVIALFLCGMVATILVRTLNKDIHQYNAMDLSEDSVQEDTGWKLLHAEVFRPPRHRMYLAVLIGGGCQLAAVVGVSLFFAILGFLSPSNRGALSTIMVVFWLLFSSISGYICSRLYISMEGKNWKQNVILAATLLPASLFASLFFINLFLFATGSSGAVPLGTMLAIIALWFLVSVPLTCVGAYFGLRHGAVAHPTSVNPIPRQIPPTPSYLRTWPSAVFCGMFSFGAGFIEIFFILSSLFGSRIYYAFGFLGLVFLVMSLTTATCTVIVIYFRLINENYRWHWASFITGAGSSMWLLLYGIYYWMMRLSLSGFSSKVLYLGYLLMLCSLNALVFGSIAFMATYLFLRRIYQDLRID